MLCAALSSDPRKGQAEQICYDYVLGRPLAYSVDYRKLDPLTSHVWELKTPDVRIFGWFSLKRNFVAVCGSLKKGVPKYKKYEPFIRAVTDFRAALDLDEPKAITGVNHNDVI
jgi:hypothetical protein